MTNGSRVTKIVSGVTFDIDDNQFVFDWTTDNPEKDILLLNEDTSGVFDENGVGYFSAYTYNPNAEPEQVAEFRRALKSVLPYSANNGLVNDEDVDRFVEDGVLRLNRFKPLKDFSLIVHIKPTKINQLLDTMHGFITKYVSCGGRSIELLKNMHDNVQFDKEKARQVLLEHGYDDSDIESHIRRVSTRFENAKRKKKLFQIKDFIPKEIRHGFSDFLKFDSEADRKLYNSLQGIDVLIYDDFYTSGATVREVIRLLRSIHEDNTLTAFTLIKQ